MGVQDEAEHVVPADAQEWRDWLETNHASVRGAWVTTTRDGDGAISYEDAVLEALCQGWVDGQIRTREVGGHELWFSPRRPASAWARSNRDRVALLETEGRMRDAGRRAVEVARENGMWSVLEGPEALLVPDDLAAALTSLGAREFFDALPPSARKGALTHVAMARTAPTREADRRRGRGVRRGAPARDLGWSCPCPTEHQEPPWPASSSTSC